MTDSQIKACVFDAYGTLFDVHSAVSRFRDLMGPDADKVSAMWRTKQLEYTWLRSLMGEYKDFYSVTGDALDYALSSHEIDNENLRRNLLDAYMTLDCYAEVPDALGRLKDDGMSLSILSNGSPIMLESAVKSAGLMDYFDCLLSVDEIGIFKPDMRVYQLACDRLNVTPAQVSFQSSNAWDACGAKCFGFQVAWINRFNQQKERLGFSADHEQKDLTDLPDTLK
ncbi:MAG: 2-haloacid dehalogenase [Gammaproteobacteria bacterium]|jgi:2-haloacid dehalogenase